MPDYLLLRLTDGTERHVHLGTTRVNDWSHAELNFLTTADAAIETVEGTAVAKHAIVEVRVVRDTDEIARLTD